MLGQIIIIPPTARGLVIVIPPKLVDKVIRPPKNTLQHEKQEKENEQECWNERKRH